MPKLPPPPRRPQSSPGFSPSLAWTSRPSAVTTSAARRLSQARPYLRISQPMPPPSVNPATPVEETRPPVVASPCACVSWSTSAQTAPPPTVARRALGSTWTSLIGDRSITTRLAGREAGDAMAATANGDLQVVAAREIDRGDHVGRSRAPDHKCRAAAVVGAIPDPARLRVAGVVRRDDLSSHRAAQVVQSDSFGHWRDGLADALVDEGHAVLLFGTGCFEAWSGRRAPSASGPSPDIGPRTLQDRGDSACALGSDAWLRTCGAGGRYRCSVARRSPIA